MKIALDKTWVYEQSYETTFTNKGYPWSCLFRDQNFGSVLGFHLEPSWPSEKSFYTALEDAIFLRHHNQVFGRIEEPDVFYIPREIAFMNNNMHLGSLNQVSNKIGFNCCALLPEKNLPKSDLENIYVHLDKYLLKIRKSSEVESFSVNRIKCLDLNSLEESMANFFFKDYNFRASLKTGNKARFKCWKDSLSYSQISRISKSELENLLTLK